MTDADLPSEQARLFAERLAQLEMRLGRLESLVAARADAPAGPEPLPAVLPVATPSEEELELAVGQSWFAIAGVIVLTLGALFLLARPFAGVPAGVPSVVGGLVVAGMFGVAHAWRKSFETVANYLRGAGMTLLFFSMLRLCFPIESHVLEPDSSAASILLVGAVGLNFWIALRRQSPWLTTLALVTGGIGVAVVGLSWLALGGMLALAGGTSWVSERRGWPGLAFVALVATYGMYLAWALGPLRTAGLHFATSPAAAPAVILACTVIFAAGPWMRPPTAEERAGPALHAMLNCGLGYALYFVHTLVSFPAAAVWSHGVAFGLYIAIAFAYWRRHASRGPTFFYAMTGYVALSVAILKLAPLPGAFVWLSVQSLIVLATAIGFHSRFIVVANFLIYVVIVLGYMIDVTRETGISLIFGVVALGSARILNWQKDRLELKTGLMRNAYLLGAFVIFPYAIYHLVAPRYAGLAWIGLALVYYALNLIIRNQKYRWMGHATLLLTTIYLVVAGTRSFEPAYRVLSFLALGTVLIVVSLVFTRAQRNARAGGAREGSPEVGGGVSAAGRVRLEEE